MYRKKYKPVILIDLDGVLNNYGLDGNKYNENIIPEIKPGARAFLKKLYSLNKYNLILFTSRNLLLASKWLIENNIDMYFTNVTNVKVPAFLHIDDRAVCFNNDFDATFKDITEFKPYWKCL